MGREDIKQKRKRQLHRRMTNSGFVTLIVIMGICVFFKSRSEEKDAEQTGAQEQQNIESDTEDLLSPVDEKVLMAREAAESVGAPEEIIELLDKNTETADFVEKYGELKDVPPADTVGELPEDGSLPHLLQWDTRWGYQLYGESYIAVSGCGPTCLSMVITGLTGDTSVTPYVLAKYAEENGYLVAEGGTYAAFMRDPVTKWGITATESLENEAFVRDETAKGNPIACNLNPGKYFTDVGHFIIITGYEDGMITVLDPFSIENTEKEWKYSDIKEQIAGLYSYTVTE